MPDIASLTIVFRGAGDVASGAALRLYNAGLRRIILLETARPMAVRRTVSFSEAVYEGEILVEGVRARLASSPAEIPSIWKEEALPVLVDPDGTLIRGQKPDVVIEATIAKRKAFTSRMPLLSSASARASLPERTFTALSKQSADSRSVACTVPAPPLLIQEDRAMSWAIRWKGYCALHAQVFLKQRWI